MSIIHLIQVVFILPFAFFAFDLSVSEQQNCQQFFVFFLQWMYLYWTDVSEFTQSLFALVA